MEKQQPGWGGAPMNDFSYRKTYRLDKIYSVQISQFARHTEVWWEPYLPTAGKRRSLSPEYRKALQAFFDGIDPGKSYPPAEILARFPRRYKIITLGRLPIR
jgi:hypothetical protein